MKGYAGIGFLVSKISTLFPLWKQVNMQVGFKAFKIWEDRPENIANIPKNDVIVLEDDPYEAATTQALNEFLRRGGILVQLFSSVDNAGSEHIMKDGKLVTDAYKALLQNIDAEDFAKRCAGLDMTCSKETGTVISFSKNVFTAAGNESRGARPRNTEDDEQEEGTQDKREEVFLNFDFFMNLLKYLAGLKQEEDKKKSEEMKVSATTTAIMIHGASIWLDKGEKTIEKMVAQVFHHLNLDDFLPQVYKERDYRNIDPDVQDRFPEIVYYHCSFVDDDNPESGRLASKYIDQAKKVQATIRAEKRWEFDAIPVFFLDLARYCSETTGIKKLYLYPPLVVGDKTRESSLKLLIRCFLEPLASKGVESFQLAWNGPAVAVTPFIADITKIKPWLIDEHKKMILLHGPELTTAIKDKTIPDFLSSLNTMVDGAISSEGTLKILVQVTVDTVALQNKIKEMTFNIRKVDDKRKEKIKKEIERTQERLHMCMRVDKDRKIFEDRGFTVIEVEDSTEIDQDIKLFLIDQVLPFILAKKIGRVFELLPPELEAFFKTLASPLVPVENMKRIVT
nr:hypothetical protein [Candidatus Sigynarchaeota archaeon]